MGCRKNDDDDDDNVRDIKVGEALPRELNGKQMMLDQLQRSRLEPQKTKDDVVSPPLVCVSLSSRVIH